MPLPLATTLSFDAIKAKYVHTLKKNATKEKKLIYFFKKETKTKTFSIQLLTHQFGSSMPFPVIIPFFQNKIC